MDAPMAEAILLVLGIVLAALQITHTLMGIRKKVGTDDADEPRQ